MAIPGQLIVNPICAELYRDVEAFGRMDPYCVVTVGDRQERTQIAENAGKYPSWSDQLVFQIFNEESIRVQAWDRRHMVGDEEIGSAEILIFNARQMGAVEESVELFHHGRGVGTMRLSIRFLPQYAKSGYPPQPGYAPYYVNPPY